MKETNNMFYFTRLFLIVALLLININTAYAEEVCIVKFPENLNACAKKKVKITGVIPDQILQHPRVLMEPHGFSCDMAAKEKDEKRKSAMMTVCNKDIQEGTKVERYLNIGDQQVIVVVPEKNIKGCDSAGANSTVDVIGHIEPMSLGGDPHTKSSYAGLVVYAESYECQSQ